MSVRLGPRRGARLLGLSLLAFFAAGEAGRALLFRVGPGGDFANVPAALLALQGHPDEDVEIALVAGSFSGALLQNSGRTGTVTISGGWSADWSVRTEDPGLTVVTPLGQSFINSAGGSLRVENLTLAGGSRPVWLSCRAGDEVVVDHVVVRDFVVTGGVSPSGGGISISSDYDCAGIVVRDSVFRHNRIDGGAAENYQLGGAGFFFDGGGPMRLERSTFSDNVVATSAQSLSVDGAGFVAVSRKGDVDVVDVRVLRNVVEAPNVPAINNASAGCQFGSYAGRTTADRLVVDGNRGSRAQLSLLNVGTGDVTLRDSVVARSDAAGISLATVEGAVANLSFLTVVDNAGAGVEILGPGTARVAGSIVLGNGTAFSGTFASTAGNLTAGDPKFVARETGDYRLLAGSPAIDAGSASPPGGLGTFDVRGAERLAGAAPDQGAYELGPSHCQGDEDTLCLGNGRFAVDVAWRTKKNQRGVGTAVPLTGDSGTFWFFDAANVELLVKSIDGCGLNRRFWVFAGGLTDVETKLAVEDTATGQIRQYTSPQGTSFVPLQDTDAFKTCTASYDPAGSVVPAPPTPYVATGSFGCVPDAKTLCLSNGRFRVRAHWRTADAEGDAGVVPLTADTGTLWFFSATNVEMVIKVLDACALNQRIWAFFTGLTNVEVDLEVYDGASGQSYEFHNPQGTAFPPVLDTAAFQACGA